MAHQVQCPVIGEVTTCAVHHPHRHAQAFVDVVHVGAEQSPAQKRQRRLLRVGHMGRAHRIGPQGFVNVLAAPGAAQKVTHHRRPRQLPKQEAAPGWPRAAQKSVKARHEKSAALGLAQRLTTPKPGGADQGQSGEQLRRLLGHTGHKFTRQGHAHHLQRLVRVPLGRPLRHQPDGLAHVAHGVGPRQAIRQTVARQIEGVDAVVLAQGLKQRPNFGGRCQRIDAVHQEHGRTRAP